MVQALSDAQKKIYQSHVNYFDIEVCTNGQSDANAGSSTGAEAAGDIPSEGKDVGASEFIDTTGYRGPIANTYSYAELSPAGLSASEVNEQTATNLGRLEYKQKLAITYKGKTVVAEKLDIGQGGGPIEGKRRDIDLLYNKTAKALGVTDPDNWTGVVNVKAVADSTPLGPATTSDTTSNTSAANGTTATNNNKVYVIGDSLTVGMRDEGDLQKKLTDGGMEVTDIEATGGISIDASIPKLKADKDKAVSTAGTILVALGTNRSSDYPKQIDAMLKAIKDTAPNAKIAWINAYSTKESYTSFNELLDTRQKDGKIDQILDWAKEAKDNPSDYDLSSDPSGIHTGGDGYKKRSSWVVSSLKESGAAAGASSTTGCCPPGGSTTLTGDGNEEKVWNYFIGKGFTNIQVAAVMGNLKQESGFNPTIQNSGPSGAYGIGQWTSGRKARLQSLPNYTDLGVQLDYMWKELNTTGSGGYKIAVLDPLMKATDLTEAVDIWLEHYEIPCNVGQCGPELALRTGFARTFLNKANGSGAGTDTAATADTPDSGSSGCDSSGSGGAPGEYKNPFHDLDGVGESRIDEGVDYYATGSPVPVYAIGNGEVTLATDHSTFYRPSDGASTSWITYKLTDGPAAGKYIYVSEFCPISVHTGDKVDTSTKLCDMQQRSIEMGWAQDATTQIAAAYESYQGHHGYKTAYGVNFSQLMKKLGAPPGHLGSGVPNTVAGTLPSDWPKW